MTYFFDSWYRRDGGIHEWFCAGGCTDTDGGNIFLGPAKRGILSFDNPEFINMVPAHLHDESRMLAL
jgi:hypothetical protein